MAKADTVDEYRFEGCTVSLASREVVVDSVPRALERRAFDLLVYLIENRDHAVTKKELLREVWANMFLSEAVLATSILKVRRAFGSLGRRGEIIKTIHRIGYRFVAQLDGLSPEGTSEMTEALRGQPIAARPAAAATVLDVPRLVWLPTYDGCHSAQTSWVSLGFMGVALVMLGKARLPHRSANETLAIFDMGDSEAEYDQQFLNLQAEHPHEGVVATKIRPVDRGFRLDCTLAYAGARRATRFVGAAPADLPARAAAWTIRAVQGIATPGDTTAGEQGLYPGLALRAMRARTAESFERAQPLLAACLDLDDRALDLFSEYVMVLAVRSDLCTLDRAHALAADASARGERQHEGWAFSCMMVFHLYDAQFELAAECGSTALWILREADAPVMLAMTLLFRAQVDAIYGDFERASKRVHEASLLELPLVRPDLDSWIVQQRGTLAFHQGRIMESGKAFLRSLDIARTAGLHMHMAWCHAYSGVAGVGLGDFALAQQHFIKSVDAADDAGVPRAQIYALMMLGVHSARTGDAANLHRALERLSNRALLAVPLGSAALRRVEAAQALAQGNFSVACDHFAACMPALSPYGMWWLDGCQLAAMQAALASNRLVQAQAMERSFTRVESFYRSDVKQAISAASRGMLAYFEGNTMGALAAFKEAGDFAVEGQLAVVVDFAACWIEKLGGASVNDAHLYRHGAWIQTPNGRLVSESAPAFLAAEAMSMERANAVAPHATRDFDDDFSTAHGRPTQTILKVRPLAVLLATRVLPLPL